MWHFFGAYVVYCELGFTIAHCTKWLSVSPSVRAPRAFSGGYVYDEIIKRIFHRFSAHAKTDIARDTGMARPRVREKILDAAYSLLQRDGIAAMTTRHIAVCAGTTEASVFNNFGDKAGLLYALVGERLPEVQAVKLAINAELQGDMSAWLRSVYEHAELFYSAIIPLTASLWGREEFLDNAMAGERHPMHGLLVVRLRELQSDGILAPSLDAKALAVVLLGAALHNSFNVVAHGSAALNEKVAERSVRIVASLLPLFTAAD